MKILFVTFGLPVPPDSGARIRDFNLIKRVSEHHEVSVLSLLEFQDELERAASLEAYCAHVDGVVADRGWPGTAATAIGGMVRGRPIATAPFYYPGLARRIHLLTHSRAFDLVQIEHSFLAPYRSALAPHFNGATVLSLHNIGVQQYRSMLDMSSGMARILAGLKWRSMRGWEAHATRHFDRTIVVSDKDRELLRSLGVRFGVSTIENGVDCDVLRPLAEPPPNTEEILFIGTMGYLPNRDAMRYFCREILPIIRARRPGCRLTIVGSGGFEHLSDLAKPGVVKITGRVADPLPFYARARLAIVPLRSGGGSRLKILEAMALGRPVVSTSLGSEGLELEDGKELLTADEPLAFAEHVLRLLEDNHYWHSLASAARSKVEHRYHWDLAASQLLDLYERLCPWCAKVSPGLPRIGSAPVGAKPRLSVIVPVYNMRQDLIKCLDALEQSQMRDFQLIIVDDNSGDGSDKVAQLRCDDFIRQERNGGQAVARNRGAQYARADLLFFLDADVLVEPDTLERILDVFENEPDISAAFCSYQPDTPARNFVSQYKNLLHHYTHQFSNRDAATFCGGFGAIRRELFVEIGGFDESHRAMEDVELGYRLHKAGHRILLCPWIQLTHTKQYTLSQLVRNDLLHRAIPWTRIMLEQQIFRRDLNTRGNNIVSVMVVFLMIAAPFLPVPGSWFLMIVEASLLLLLVLFNKHFLLFLRRLRGTLFSIRAVPMICLQYCYSGLGLLLGTLIFARDRLTALWKPSELRSK